MEINALGYIGINSARIEEWSGYATGLLGMQQVDRGDKVRAFRMDDRKQRLVVTGAEDEGLGFMGWEVADAAALDALASRLENAGVAVALAPQALADERFVAHLIRFRDPEGNMIEVFHGPQITTEAFQPGRSISGFKTGALGMGHAVLKAADVDRLIPFYVDLLGFKVSDYIRKPFPIYFFHCNARHHSFAMAGTGTQGFHHFMVEYQMLDDVGHGYDLAQTEADRLAFTLGRHTNDYMQSFYTHSPSGFFIESGFGGLLIDPGSWEPYETHDGPSLWGHDRLYMEEGPRRALEAQRLDLARRGVRAPNCPWMSSMLEAAE
ncbi:VOC family protein [Pseudodonghicola flavimaris]|uniref:VOC family protein n=1 Tax=Pseudodonghicola flavimaris TaxID=3050036 RepID=A0ABT7F2I8_9RHOB|nr:VOC family protein [Pseudodonghicola flavimaris]MDK3018818.1 VOC family protein [Pseudodonghicola flavimaris]